MSILTADTGGQANVVDGILQSTEALDRVVEGYYLQYLGRVADSTGLSYWVGLIQGGASLETIQAGFIASPEFISNNNSDYIQGLYRTFFGRTGSSSELAYWYGQLPSLGLAGVAQGFATSTENRQQFITEIYREISPPDADQCSGGDLGWAVRGSWLPRGADAQHAHVPQ